MNFIVTSGVLKNRHARLFGGGQKFLVRPQARG
jgi:hypothetical protein